MKFSGFGLLLLCLLLQGCSEPAPKTGLSKPNILFIIADDLRPDLGAYGDKIAVTPQLDRLAAGSIVFNRAYCQKAVCW
ncbi:MAG: sulfatase-like hydrolase/transferase, partial [Verrucomicrobiae bacterium]|nr:sulfatase-like hydrolase/transferase [Verrucomicrobiae bacterium]